MRNKIDARVIKIAKLVREKVTKWTKDNKDVDEDLCGACAIASYTLWRVLGALGYDSTLVCLSIEGESHCWIEMGDELIDVTATQFYNKTYPKVFVDRVDYWIDYFADEEGNNYDDIEILKNKPAIDYIKGWNLQAPVSYYKEINRLCRQVTKDFVLET